MSVLRIYPLYRLRFAPQFSLSIERPGQWSPRDHKLFFQQYPPSTDFFLHPITSSVDFTNISTLKGPRLCSNLFPYSFYVSLSTDRAAGGAEVEGKNTRRPSPVSSAEKIGPNSFSTSPSNIITASLIFVNFFPSRI